MRQLSGNGLEGAVVITGAAEGIGKALVRSFIDDGHPVVAVDLNGDRLEVLAEELREASGKVITERVDVADAEAMQALADRVFEVAGSVKLLINNAGIESVGYLWEISVDTWRKVQSVNADAVFYGVKAFLPKMATQASGGHIVNVSSVAAVTNSPRNGAYGVAKHAVQAMTEILYVECREKYPQIKVSVVCPAAVKSRIFEDALIEGSDTSDDSRTELLEMQKYLSEYGISVDDAAARIRAGIDSGDFWITTHPQRFKELAHKRAEFLGNQLSPAPNIAEERL